MSKGLTGTAVQQQPHELCITILLSELEEYSLLLLQLQASFSAEKPNPETFPFRLPGSPPPQALAESTMD